MPKKLNLITVLFVSMFLTPLPSYAQGGFGGGGGLGGRGLGNRGGSGNVGVGLRIPLPGDSRFYTPDLTPADKSHGILKIKITEDKAEIYIDGRFIGSSADFKESVFVSVPSGDHVVEFKGSDLRTANVNVVSGSTTFIVR